MVDLIAPIEADTLSQVRSIVLEFNSRSENEADTRHRLIDVLLHDVFAWPRNRVDTERHVRPGFADYILKKSTDDDVLFIEAKKSGFFFTLPIAHNAEETSTYIAIGKLLTDANIKEAMTQVRTYCLESGCEYGCVTNGHEWIFFKIFERGKRWDSLNAFVIRNLSFFEQEYTRAYNIFSFIGITERLSLLSLLTSAPPKDRDIYYAKDRISSYSPQASPHFHETAISLWIALDRCITSAKRCMRGRRRTSGMLGMRS